jgi:glycosyltransferase involved in cell wall biosynthesis
METKIPQVSLGLPVYNGEKYLPKALKSLLEQDHEDFELIISDNASTDNTEAICRGWAVRDSRIRYSRNETNIGATGNYNRVFSLARGEFFKWASHDDECHPSLIRRCLETFSTAPKTVVLVFSKSEIIDEAGRVKHLSPDIINATSSRPQRRMANVMFNSAYVHPLWGLIRSDALRRTRMMGAHEADHVLLAELALQGQFIEIPEVLYGLRRHERSATMINRSARELLAWHDPKLAHKRIFLPHWERVYVEYFKAVRHVSLPLSQRLLCFGQIPVVCYWRRFLRWTGPLRQRIGLKKGRDLQVGPTCREH